MDETLGSGVMSCIEQLTNQVCNNNSTGNHLFKLKDGLNFPLQFKMLAQVNSSNLLVSS